MFVRLIVIIAIFVVAVAWGARRSDSAAREQVYVVQAGDTLWTIAAVALRRGPARGASGGSRTATTSPARSSSRASARLP